MNPIERMASYENSYSEAEARVYQLVMSDPEVVRSHTITKVGQMADASPSAVMRFCQRMGYAGYKDFRFDLVRHLDESEPDGLDEGTPSRVARSLSDACASLAHIDLAVFEQLAKDLRAADEVYCTGIYRSYLPAEKLRMDLVDLGIRAVSAGDEVSIGRIPYIASERSAIVVFSEGGDLYGHRGMLESVRETCRNTYVVTCAAEPNLAALCEHVLVIPRPLPVAGSQPDAHAIMFALIEMTKDALKA